MQPAKINYKIYQGSTFQESYRWESATKVYLPLTAISKSAPCVLTTQSSHVLPVGWRFRVVGAGGMKEINSIGDTYYLATNTTGTSVEVNQVNSLQYTTYTSGGVIEYNQPVDLQNFNARMQIRETVDSSQVLYQTDSITGNIIINNTLKSIMITIPAADTQQFNFSTAVYSVELYNSTEVLPFLVGNLSLVQEITR